MRERDVFSKRSDLRREKTEGGKRRKPLVWGRVGQVLTQNGVFARGWSRILIFSTFVPMREVAREWRIGTTLAIDA
jgi:hypothetical protein